MKVEILKGVIPIGDKQHVVGDVIDIENKAEAFSLIKLGIVKQASKTEKKFDPSDLTVIDGVDKGIQMSLNGEDIKTLTDLGKTKVADFEKITGFSKSVAGAIIKKAKDLSR